MGQKIVLTDAFTDTTLPLLRDDPLLTAGSIFLYDPSHSAGAFSGVADDTAIPNIAWKEAQAVIGSGTQTTLGGKLKVQIVANDQAKIERTSKGGVHFIISQTNDSAGPPYNFCNVLPRGLVQTYIDNNVDHDLYFSTWVRLTRRQILPSGAPQSYFHKAENTSNYLFFLQAGDVTPVSGAALLGRDTANPAGYTNDIAVGAAIFRSLGVTAYTGTKPALSGSGDTAGIDANGVHFTGGRSGAWSTAIFNQNKAPSLVLERMYIEDLTVSGRTYAQVDALDLALFNDMHAVGGRWYGDTYTAPSTLP